MSSSKNGPDSQRWILLRIWSSFQRACGLFSSMEIRRRACSTLLRLVVKLCHCSPAKEAEYFSTQRYSWPCTSSFSAAARTPGWALLQSGNCSTARSRNAAGAWFQGRAEIQPTPALPWNQAPAAFRERAVEQLPLCRTLVTHQRDRV